MKFNKILAWFLLISLNLSPALSFAAKAPEAAKDAVWVNQVFQKGKAFYEAGDTKSAVREWSALDPYLDQYPSFQKVINYLKSQIPNATVAVKKEQPQAASDGWSASPPEVREAFNRGRLAYQAGDWNTAMAQWEKIIPYLDPAGEESKLIQKLKMDHETLKVTGDQNEGLSTQPKVVITPPGDLAALMREAQQKLKDHIQVMESRRQNLEKEAIFEQAWVNSTFENGKTAYTSGQYDRAIEEWDKLIFKLGRDPQLKNQIEELKKSYNEYQQTQIGFANATAAQENSGRPADDAMRIYFEQVEVDLAKKSKEIALRGQEMQASQAEQQRHVQEIFDKGKVQHLKGNTREAMDQWMLLSRYFDNNTALRSAFLSAQATVHSYEQANLALQQLPDSETYKLQIPEGLSNYLEETAHQLSAKTREAEAKREKTEKAIGSKRAEVLQAFEVGKTMYADGKLSEAVASWRKVIPWVEDGESIEAELQRLEASSQTLLKETQALRTVEQSAAKYYTPPADFLNQLKEANRGLKNQTESATNSRLTIQQGQNEKQAQATSQFHKANFAYQAGKTGEAISELEKLIPYLDSLSEEKVLIENLKQNQADYNDAAEKLSQAKSAKENKIRIPEDLKTALIRTNSDLIKQTNAAVAQRSALETEISAAQTQARSAFEKGNMSFQGGRLQDALESWKTLRGQWAGQAQDDVLIDSLAQNQIESQEARKKLDEAKARKADKVQIPDGLKAELIRTNTDLIKQTNDAMEQRSTLEAKQSELETLVSSAFEKGKMSFQGGRLQDALAEWKTLRGHWKGESQDEALIDSLAQNQIESQDARKKLEEAKAKKVDKIQISDDLKTAFIRVNFDLVKQTNLAIEQRRVLEAELSATQTQVQSAFEKGKMSFQGGRLQDALDEWKILPAYLDEKSDVPDLLHQLETRLKDYNEAERGLQLISAKKNVKQEAPAELSTLLRLGSEKVAAETQQLQGQRSALQTEVQEQNIFVAETFELGKKLATEGKWQEAVNEWGKLKTHLDSASEIPSSLENLNKSLRDLEETRRSNAEFTANVYHNLKIPFTEEMTKLLGEMEAKIRNNTKTAQDERLAMEKSLTERESWVNSTFEKGKAYYDVGKYKEAIEFWLSLKPHLKDEFKIQSLLAGLQDRYENMVSAQKLAEQAMAKKEMKFTAPAELPKLLTELSEKMGALNFEASSQTAKAEQAYADRRGALDAIFQKGEVLYQAGDMAGALKEWSALPAYLEDENKIKALLDNLNISYQNLLAAQKEAQDAQARQDQRFSAPQGLSDLLLDSARKLDKESQVTDLDRQRSEKAMADRQASIQAVFAEGKTFYDQGKMNEAFLRWRSLLPSMTEEKELGEQLTKAEQSYQHYVNSKQQNQEALAKKEMKVVSPSELSQILDTANRSLGDQIFDMKNRTAQTGKMLEDRKDWVDVTFRKGKLAYNQGLYKEAAAEWNTLMPFIENGDDLRAALADFERNLQLSMDSSKIMEEVSAKSTGKFQAPDELGVLLTQLNDKVKSEALEANASKIKAEQTSSERQKWISQTFDLGRSFYQEGKTGDAIGEWSKLAPYLDEKSGMRQLLDAVKQNHEASSIAKKGAVEAAASDYQGLKLPYAEQMSKLLTDADEKLRSEAMQYQTKQQEVEKTMAERQEWSVTTFNKGKIFYDQGQYDEALNHWERLLPYLAEGSDLKAKIQSLRTNYNMVIAGRNELGGPSENERPVTLKNEDEVLSVLNDANIKLRAQAEEAHARAASSEKVIQDRQEWIEYTFQKGKVFYDQGNYSKAVEEWGILGPYLTEHPKVRDSIEEAKKNYSEGKMAQRVIESVEAKKAAFLPLPENAQAPIQDAAAEESATNNVPQPANPDGQGQNAQLVSGEIVSIDAGQRTLAVKLYSESGLDETLTVNFDESTQVDGSDTQTISSIQSGSNIDLRYNPQTSRAVYIYVY